MAELFAVLGLDSALEVYAAKSLYSKSGRCDYFDSSMAAKPGAGRARIRGSTWWAFLIILAKIPTVHPGFSLLCVHRSGSESVGHIRTRQHPDRKIDIFVDRNVYLHQYQL